jgi:hypothetical protein
MNYHDPLNARLVLPFQRPRDGRSALSVLPSLPHSAFCAAVNQIRDVTMAHLLTAQD